MGRGGGRRPRPASPVNLPVVLRRLAQAEFDDAFDWWEEQRIGRGVEFAAAVRETLREIGEQPMRYPEVRANVREAPVNGEQYAVYYRIEQDHVIVIAVFHTSRNPAEWERRI